MKQVQTAIIDLDADRMVAVDEEARSLWEENKRLINCEKIIKKYLAPLPGKYQVSLLKNVIRRLSGHGNCITAILIRQTVLS